MKKLCLTYKVWQEKNGFPVGKAVVVKFSPWEAESDSWSDVSSMCYLCNPCLWCMHLFVRESGKGGEEWWSILYMFVTIFLNRLGWQRI